MLPLNDLTHAERGKYEAALFASHALRVQIEIQSLEGKPLADRSKMLLDGQVDVDAGADVTRSASLSFYDPDHSLNFDSNSPSDGVLYADRMIQITYGINVPALGQWVDVPIFTGPVTKLDRSEDVVNVECQGKEALAGAGDTGVAAWHKLTLKKGHSKAKAIKEILAELAGETRFDIPEVAANLPHDLSIGGDDSPWRHASRLAKSMERQLFYDGRGVLRLRRPPDNPLFTFRQNHAITAPPQLAFATEQMRNTVRVKGGPPKGAKTDDDPDTNTPKKVPGVTASVTAPRQHPLSPWKLARNGVPRFLLEVVDNDHIRSNKEAKRVANRVLNDRLEEALDVTLESLVVPHLDPGDLVRVSTDDLAATFRLRRYTIPLSAGGTMSVGFHKNIPKVNARRIRRR